MTSAAPASGAGARLDRAVRAAVGQPLAWVLVIAAIASWPVVWSIRARVPPPPPVLGAVPAFRLSDPQGRAFGSRDLAGRVWLAGFVVTECEAPCPAVTRMARVQGRTRSLEPALHLVSFSLDPGHRAPGRLAAFARAHRASPRMWTFLTGPAGEVRGIADEVLRAGAGGSTAAVAGARVVLVDGAARVRGTYDLADDGAVDRVVRDAALLVNRR